MADLVAGLDMETVQHFHSPVPVKILIEVFKKVHDVIHPHPVSQVHPFREIGDERLCFDAWHLPGDGEQSLRGDKESVDQFDHSRFSASVRAPKVR